MNLNIFLVDRYLLKILKKQNMNRSWNTAGKISTTLLLVNFKMFYIIIFYVHTEIIKIIVFLLIYNLLLKYYFLAFSNTCI